MSINRTFSSYYVSSLYLFSCLIQMYCRISCLVSFHPCRGRGRMQILASEFVFVPINSKHRPTEYFSPTTVSPSVNFINIETVVFLYVECATNSTVGLFYDL